MPKHRPRRRARSVRQRTAAALAGGALAVLPTVTASGLISPVAHTTPDAQKAPAQAAPARVPDVVMPPVAVDGSLPQPPVPEPLAAPGTRVGSGSAGVSGPLGIPASMLRAYQNAADIMAREQPNCHVDWALLASIGRIESNHARGGYVDAKGNTLERILGPALNGTSGFAAIPAVDGGRLTGDPVWDHAVGAMQFITGTWKQYASDGNGDGVSDPNNVYDATLAAGRYLCSGNLDLSSDEAQRVAVRRYNNSQSYVDTVMAWAAAYRGGVAKLPDSEVPIGAPPNRPAEGAPGAVPPPPPPPGTPAPGTPGGPGAETPGSTLPPTGTPSTSTTPTTSTPPSTPPTTPPSTTTSSPAPTTSSSSTPPATPSPSSSTTSSSSTTTTTGK